MAMDTIKSATSKANLSQTFPFENNNNIRDASFSSFLNSNEETFVCKLADNQSNRNLSPLTNSTTTFQEEHNQDHEEIGVFGAEKYFNGVMDDQESSPKSASTISTARKYHHHHHNSKEQLRVNLDHLKIKVQHGTPSVGSESSWNSQSALLRSGSRNPYTNNNKPSSKAQRKNFFASLGCKCSCSDKNSVDVNEHVGEVSFKKNNGATTPPIKNKPAGVVDLVDEALVEMNNHQKLEKLGSGLNRENCFTFPISKSGVGDLPLKMSFQEEEEKLRKSLEVFGSPVLEKRNKSLSFDKRLTMLPWDEFPAKSGGLIHNDHHESDSDASSDLFEIESLTGKANPFLARQASDATSGCVTPTTCYAPSEASIEWSVVTASAADFSAMSDCEEQRPSDPLKMVPTNTTTNAKTRMNVNKEVVPRHHRPTALLGCKSQKAVKVAGDAHRRCHEKTSFDTQMMMRHRPDSFMPATRFQVENTKFTGFESRVQGQQHALAARSLPRSHSPHASHLLFMQ